MKGIKSLLHLKILKTPSKFIAEMEKQKNVSYIQTFESHTTLNDSVVTTTAASATSNLNFEPS